MTWLHLRLVAATAAVVVLCVLIAPARAGVAPASPASYHLLEPTAVSAVNPSTWWVLEQSPSCLTFNCKSTLLETTDAGRSFTARGPLPDVGPTGVSAVNDDRDVFVSDSRGHVWLSTDAGASWRDIVPSGHGGKPLFQGMPTTGGGYAYAVAWPSKGSGYELLRASMAALKRGVDPNSAWKRLSGPSGTASGLAVIGSEVLLLVQPPLGFPSLYVSTDAGGSFKPTGAKLPAIGCSFYPTGSVIWADCATGMLFGIWRSTDAGRTFTAAGSDAYRTPPARDHPVFAGTSGASFAALSPSTALLGLSPLYRTTDGGRSYHPLQGTPAGIDQWLRFDVLGPDDVLAIGHVRAGGSKVHPRFLDRLYAVTAAGTRYRRIRIG